MTSNFTSKFYCESNGDIFVTRWLPVPEICRLGFVAKKWVWNKIFDDVILWVKILLRIQRWYFRHKAISRSGDIQVRVRGQKVDMVKNFRRRQILSQNYTANPTVVLSSTTRLPVPEIGRLSNRGVAENFRWYVILWIRILMRIQLLYFNHQATSGYGEIQVRGRGQKVGVLKNFRWRQILSQNFPANPTVVYSSPPNFWFRR